MESHKLSIQEVRDYVRTDPDSRPLKFFDSKFLETEDQLSLDQIKRIDLLTGGPSKLSLQQLQKFMIDLSWASSRLEGNTYDYLDTKLLLEEGIRSSNNSMAEAKMIINHKHAITELYEDKPLSTELVRDVHRLLADDTGVEGNEHFLPPHRCGLVRTYEPLDISGSAYNPVVDQPGKPVIGPSFDRIINSANQLHPINASLYLLTRLPYLQPFGDCNKRTSRVIANSPLIKNGYLPVSFKNVERRDYLSSMVAFYELGDERPMKDEFVRALIDSLMINKAGPLELSVAYSNDKKVITEKFIDFINTGKISDCVNRMLDARKPKKDLDPGLEP